MVLAIFVLMLLLTLAGVAYPLLRPASADSPAMASTPTRRQCARCGRRLDADERFCAGCGAPAPAESRCAACGRVLADDERFCPRCGTPAGGMAQ